MNWLEKHADAISFVRGTKVVINYFSTASDCPAQTTEPSLREAVDTAMLEEEKTAASSH